MDASVEFMAGYSARIASSIPVENRGENFDKGWKSADNYLRVGNEPSYIAMLEDMLYNNELFRVERIHVTWGPEAHKLTAEERAKVLYTSIVTAGEPIENIDDPLPDTVVVAAYAKGVDDFYTKAENPYPDGSDEARSWEVGYGDANNREAAAEPCYECGSTQFVSTATIDRACANCNPDL